MFDHLGPKALRSLRLFSLCKHSSNVEARKRYYALSLLHHPDKADTEEDRVKATTRQQRINDAWEILSEALPHVRIGELSFPQCCDGDPFNISSKPVASDRDPCESDGDEQRPERERKARPEKAFFTEVWESHANTDYFPEFSERQAEEAEALWASLRDEPQVDASRANLLTTFRTAVGQLIICGVCLDGMLRGAKHMAVVLKRRGGLSLLQGSLDAFQQQIKATSWIMSREGFWGVYDPKVNKADKEWFASEPKLFDGFPRPLRRLWKSVSSLYADYFHSINATPRTVASARLEEETIHKRDGILGLPKNWSPDDAEWCEYEDDLPGIEDHDTHVKSCREIAARQLLRSLCEGKTELARLVKNAKDTDCRIYIEQRAYGVYQ